MSPNINSFVGDLVAMAQAVEELPKVQSELSKAEENNFKLSETISQLHADLEQSRNYAASLEQKVRSLEVERDDASFRVLEAEDAANSALIMVRTAASHLAVVINKLDPPKPQPELQPSAVTYDEATDMHWKGDVPVHTVNLEHPTTTDQSVVDPIALIGQAEPVAHSIPAASTDAGTTTTETSSVEEATKSDANPTNSPTGSFQDIHGEDSTVEGTKSPYFGKRYYYMSNYIDYDTWITGGGTEADYYWRPSVQNSVS